MFPVSSLNRANAGKRRAVWGVNRIPRITTFERKRVRYEQHHENPSSSTTTNINITHNVTTTTTNGPTTTINNNTNNTTNTTTTTNTGGNTPAGEVKTDCDKYPGSVGCAPASKLDQIIAAINAVVQEIKNLKLTQSSTPQPTDCDKKPNSIGCMDGGTAEPGQPVPKETVNVQITPVQFGGSASCPAPVTFTVFGTTQQFSYETLCGKLASLSTFFLALAGLAAAWIFTSGFKV